MNVIADVCVVPIGTAVSISRYVAACERIFADAGLNTRLHAFGTNVEGDWDTITMALKKCHEVIHTMGAPRIMTTVKLSTRVDRDQSLDEKVESLRKHLTQDSK